MVSEPVVPDVAALTALLPDGAVLADGDGLVRLVSAPAARMLGVDAEESVGRPLADVLALQDGDGCSWWGQQDPLDGLSTRSGTPEQSWLLPDGQEVLVTARFHRDPPPRRAVRWIAVSLRSGRGRERLDRERSDLVATVAHELRSPLTGVKGFVQAMLNRWDKLSDEQKKLMLTTVSADSDRLSRLIAELLDVARIDTGRLQLYPRPVDLRVLAERVVASTAAGTSREVRLEDGPPPPSVLADQDKVTQVLTNLVENGLRHGAGEVVVRLEDAEGPDGEPQVRVVVTDEGEGIPVELRRRVFTKFWTSSTGGGSGLGLYVVHGLVRAHGGVVTIGERPGGGASIACTWPVGSV